MSDLFAEQEGMTFPAICLWQPYAELPLFDAKPWETRGRPYPAKYHGCRIVVCSTKAYTPRAFRTPALETLCEAVLGAGFEDRLQRGVALYSIVLKGCERTEDMVHRVPPELLASGDFSAGRWAWEWGDAEPFNPFPVHGGQGWFRVAVKDGAFRCAAIPAENDAGVRAISEQGSLPPDEPLALIIGVGGEGVSAASRGGSPAQEPAKSDSAEGH